MTKVKSKEVDYSKVSLGLVSVVRDVITDECKHKYSVSKVYAAYNAAFGLNETPQTCGSCLRSRVRLLRDWLKGFEASVLKASDGGSGRYDQKATPAQDQPAPQYDDPDAPGYVEQAEGTVRYPMQEGIPFDFRPNKGTLVKGGVKRADGTPIKPGTYVTAEGLEIVVKQGGWADIKENEDLT